MSAGAKKPLTGENREKRGDREEKQQLGFLRALCAFLCEFSGYN
jgi:hypothetical protein